MSPSSITLESLMAVYQSLPIPDSYLKAIVCGPQNYNFVRQSLQPASRFSVPIFSTDFLPIREPLKILRREDYATRRGYKMARNYWVRENRRMRRAEDRMVFVLSGKMARVFQIAELDLWTRAWHP